MNDCDDPYKILAATVIGMYRPADVARMLGDDKFILSQITREVREQDMNGMFLDCVISSVLSEKKRADYMKALDSLAEYYYSRLDLPRLRKEIKETLNECGIAVEYYSATGNILSANT